ncbi:MAG: beta-propeller domain-containing protein, partial [Nitrososphaerota archaeon]|nr:beta-propeller domain-containing protein [Nitrososphaerota archaeon]
MTQKEIKNKTKLYTIAAVLSALMLVGTIYLATPTTIMHTTLELSQMKPFNSIEDLRSYLTKNTVETNDEGVYTVGTSVLGRGFVAFSQSAPVSVAATLSGGETASLTASFSTTNIQVAGVDEADIVKTDGKYIYTLRSSYGSDVQIVNADAKNPMVVGKIDLDNYASGMYLSKDGNKLAILGNSYNRYPVPLNDIVSDTSKPQQTSEPSIASQYYQYYTSQAFIYVYDVSNKATPVLTRNVTLSGNYVNSRMIDNYVYLAVNQQAYADDEIVILPRISINGVTKEVAPTSIYYTDMQDTAFSYTLFNSINIMNDNEQPTSMTILMSASSCMYVSTNNMYVTFNKYENTELYRMAFNGANLNFEAEGTVPGYVLNQYSMDEYNNYFRIATTVSTGPWDNRVEYNNLYILNMNLDTVGKIENLANGERIYSARFTGDKAYLVTFKQVDPFFVLDLKNPTSPQVIGELKIPGFSSYLHPYNENYIIGLGQEGNSVKLSLFDVTDMSNPVEVAKYTISENIAELSSSSAVSYDPKAFLFDPQKQLLVIPVTASYYKSWEIEPTPITLEPGSTDNSG